MINMLKVIASEEQGFVTYLCGDAAIDVHESGALSLYVAGIELQFKRPDRLCELAVLLSNRHVVAALKMPPMKELRLWAHQQPSKPTPPEPPAPRHNPRPPAMQLLDLAGITGRVAYCNGLIREQERALGEFVKRIGMSKEEYRALMQHIGLITEAVYVTSWMNGAKTGL